jgi:hypothetical protein
MSCWKRSDPNWSDIWVGGSEDEFCVEFRVCSGCGAPWIFDYKDEGLIENILDILGAGDYVIDCISTISAQERYVRILKAIRGGKLPGVQLVGEIIR